ncbi:MAG: outer membrane beta-barrel protein [Candidatus Omnitrophica bacterium]|nr:outer membrane beta-barrel protein [Candidatus Omnitrophota bacterium]MCF7894398.1 outer membrane beta-barrel protein [Candidatus Omnitrophota bacterium]
MKYKTFFWFILSIFICSISFAQVTEEKEAVKLERPQVENYTFEPNISQKIAIFSGYDTNVKLSNQRKGDMFEEFLYSFDYDQKLSADLEFNLDYDFDYINYNEVTDISSLLNHLRLGLDKTFSLCSLGIGYDLGYLYYPKNKDGDFLIHKGFIYFRKDLGKFKYKVQFEGGSKDYISQNTLGDDISTRENTERLDHRIAAFYQLGIDINPRLYLSFRTKFLRNDSNARYLDFYDYNAYNQKLSLTYQATNKTYLLADFSYERKKYKTRTVTNQSYKQEDDFYSTRAGFIYLLDRKTAVSLDYIYRYNSSNEPLDEYNENVISCGWHYYF